MFYLVLDPCFEWAGPARTDGCRPGGRPRRDAADAPEEAPTGHRGAEEARPGQEPQHRTADTRVGGCRMAPGFGAFAGLLQS